MKKIITTIIMIFYFAVSVHAIEPITIAVVASLVIHAAIGGGMYYSMKSNVPSTVSPTGEISRSAQVQWINTADLTSGGTPTVQIKNVTAKITATKAQQIANNNPTAYPNVKAASEGYNDTTTLKEISALNSYPSISPSVGNTFSQSGNVYTITSKSEVINLGQTAWIQSNYPAGLLGNPSANAMYYYESFTGCGWPSCTKVYQIGYTKASTGLSTQPKTPEQFAANITGTTTGGSAKTLYQQELDKMLQDPSYVPTFTDDTTGLPYAPPPSSTVATPSQLDSYNAAQQSKESATNASTSAQNAVTSTGAAATNAGNNYTASGGNLSTGQGGDPALYQKYLDSKAEADKAKAEADKLKAKQDYATQKETEESGFTPPSIPSAYGDGSDLDFSGRFTTFLNTMKSSGIFALPRQLVGNIPNGGQSTFNFAFGRFGNHTFDLASFNSAILVIRSLVLIIFSLIAMKIITLKGGSG